MRTKVRTTQNFTKKLVKKSPGVSATIPDDTMSLRTMIQKHTSGQAISANVETPEYYESSGVDARSLDLTDLHEIKDSATKQQTEINKQKAEAAALAEAEAEQKIIEAKAEELLKNRERSEQP